MPSWVIDVDWWMQAYPGLTPRDVMEMDLDCFDWLPVVRAARVKASVMQSKVPQSGPLMFGRHGPGG